MRKICIINQKGGVGKTTTAVNIAAGLSRHDRKVLLIDFDAQGNISTSLSLDGENEIGHILTENADIQQSTKYLGRNLDLIPSRETLSMTELKLSALPNKEFVMKEKLNDLKDYNYVIIDCPPSLGVLNQNALLYACEAFIPVSTDYLGYDALLKMIKVIETINSRFSHKIKITKVIPTLYDKRNKTCKVYLDKISNQFYELATDPIRINSKLKEAPEHGKSIFSYASGSRGAQDYQKLIKQILNEEKQVLSEYPEESVAEELVPLNTPEGLKEFKKKGNPAKV